MGRSCLVCRVRRGPEGSGSRLREDILKHLATAHLDGKSCDASSLGEHLGVKPSVMESAVSDLLGREELLRADPHLVLSPKGLRLGLRQLRRHRLYELYLSERTGHPSHAWHRLAESAEHRLGVDGEAALARDLGYPSEDPHGDPIPFGAEGSCRRLDDPCLTEVARPGQEYLVTHVEDEPPSVYRSLSDRGVAVGVVLRVESVSDQALTVDLAGQRHVLPIAEASLLNVLARTGRPVSDGLVRLSELPEGVSARIERLSAGCVGPERRRLQDLGFVPGGVVYTELTSPLGDPRAYMVRGATIALRQRQSSMVLVRVVDPA